MEEQTKQNIVDRYNSILINIERQNIEATELGFINNSCSPILFSILIHCVENIEIFNKDQLININSFINKLSYG